MTLTLSMPGNEKELKPRITVFGVGGAGGNAVDNMINKELEGVEFVVANTDAQALQQSRSPLRIQLGVRVTEGLGAGARPSVGASAAEESIEEIVDRLAGAHMCFITAGLGGGTGTGAAPIIAQAARELGVLTVGVVTKPFQFEGAKRMRQAEEGAEALQKVVDTLIVIPNQNLFRLANEKTTFTEAFSMADDVLYQGVKGVTDLMVRPGLINLDFADVRAVMDEMGKAMMGTGESNGEERAVQSAEKAIANPLLDEISLRGARGVLINVTGGYDLTLFELDEAANRIREEVDPEANIIVGSTLDPKMEGIMRVSVVATGIDAREVEQDAPATRRRLSEPLTPVTPAKETASVQKPYYLGEQDARAPSFFEHMEAQDSEQEALQNIDHKDMRDVDFNDTGSKSFEANESKLAPSNIESSTSSEASDPVSHHSTSSSPSHEEIDALRAAAQKNIMKSQNTLSKPGEDEKHRFSGIGSLINRMTGQTNPTQQNSVPQIRSQTAKKIPQDLGVDGEDERIEIPAFLRRQAN